MPDLVAWFGPVAKFQIEGATVPGAVEKFFSCHGAQQLPLCRDIAWSFRDPDGRSLPRMVEMSSLGPGEVGDIFIGAFSAGGLVARRLFTDERDRHRLRAVILSDATYSGAWVDEQARIPVVQDELVRFAAEVADGAGDQLFVATASPAPNQDLPTGVDMLRELRRQVEIAVGRRFEVIDGFFGVAPLPAIAYRLGNVVLAEYPMEPLGHNHTKIAPQVWQKILWPWLEGARLPDSEIDAGTVPLVPQTAPTNNGDTLRVTDWLVMAAGAIVGTVAVLWFLSSSR